MSNGEKQCRVCKTPKARSDLDDTGRCRSCSLAKEATDAGMSYGKYMALRREGLLRKQQPQNRIKRQQYAEIYCKNCGGIIPNQAKYEGFCCRECEAKWEKRERDAKQRGAIVETVKPPAAPHYCLKCGKEIPRNRKYCCDTCKYLYNQEMKKQEEKVAAKTKERPAASCRNCGKEILSGLRHAWCSPECAKAGHIQQKRLRRAIEKKEREENE